MKKNSTHFHLHTVEETGSASGGEDPNEDNQSNLPLEDPERLLDKLEVKVPDRVVHRLFLRIRISSLRSRN